MNKESLELRKVEAVKHKENLVAQAHMAQGIISECDYWLSQIEDKPVKVKKKRV